MTELNSHPPDTTRWAVPISLTLCCGIGRVLAVDAELPRTVLARDLTDGGVDSRAAEGMRQHLAEEGEPAFGAGDGVGMRFHVIDDQGSLVVRRSPAAGLPDQGLKTELPAGLGRCLKAGEVRVPLAEGHCGRRAVQPQRRADPAGLGLAQQFNAEFQVPGRAQRLLLPDDGQRGWCAGRRAASC